jgi:hypothetical protein
MNHVFNRKCLLLDPDLRMKDDLEQDIAQFLAQAGDIRMVDGFQHFSAPIKSKQERPAWGLIGPM